MVDRKKKKWNKGKVSKFIKCLKIALVNIIFFQLKDERETK